MTEDIFFYLSKTVWFLANPGILLFLFLGVGTLSLWFGWQKAGRHILTWVFLAVAVLTMVPIGPLLLIPLESRFTAPNPLPAHVDGIISLGGAADPILSRAHGQVALGTGAERVTEFARLSRLYPDAKLVFTGGTGLVLNQSIKEADIIKPLFDLLDIPEDRLILENQSRNTAENASLTLARVQPKAGETWLLITSAFHMPRSVGVFRQVGWHVVPYPVDYQFAGYEWKQPTFNLIAGLTGLNQGLKEWVGLVSYRIAGRTSSWFPAPAP